MIDTGNLLKDPITGTPVIVVEKQSLKEIIEEEILNQIEGILEGKYIDTKYTENYISKFRLIPFSSLGKQNGMLIGFKPDEVKIKFDDTEIKKTNVLIRHI